MDLLAVFRRDTTTAVSRTLTAPPGPSRGVLSWFRDRMTPWLGPRLSRGSPADVRIRSESVLVGPRIAGLPWFLPFFDEHQTLAESQQMRLAYRRMLADPNVKAAILGKILAVASLEIKVLPCSKKSKVDCKVADFVRWNLEHALADGMPGAIWSILSGALIDGYSVCEKVWEHVEKGEWAGKYALRALKPKDTGQDVVLVTDPYRNVVGVQALRYNAGEIYPPSAFAIFRHLPLWNVPTGMSDLRAAYGRWWMLDTVLKLRAVGLEKRALPLLVGHYQTPQQRPSLEQALALVKSQNWLAIPEGVMVEAVNIAGMADAAFAEAVKDLKHDIFLGIEGAVLQSLEGTVTDGRGNSQVHRSKADRIAWFVARCVECLFNDPRNGVVPDVVDLNYVVASYPRVKLQAVDLNEQRANLEIDDTLSSMGLELSKEDLYERYGRRPPDPDDPDDVLAPKGGPPGPGGMEMKQPNMVPGAQGKGKQGPNAKGEKFAEVDIFTAPMRRLTARLVSRVLYGLYGSHAARMLRKAHLFAEWDESLHPRVPKGSPGGGRFARKGSDEAVKAAQDAVRAVVRGDLSRKHAAEVTAHLGNLTVAQLRELAAEHGRKPPKMLRAELEEAVLALLKEEQAEEPKAGGAITDPLDLTKENVVAEWERMRDEIVNHDPSLSPNQAGSIAAARILNATGKRANEYIDEIDAKVRRGESITDEEDNKYIEAGDKRKELATELYRTSGYRPGAGVDGHPLAQRPLDASPLENRAEGMAQTREANAKKAAEVAERTASEAKARKEKHASERRELEKQQKETTERQMAKARWYSENAGRGAKEADRRAAVESALAAGKPVPPEVLADYPDLAPKAKPDHAQASAAATAAPANLDALAQSYEGMAKATDAEVSAALSAIDSLGKEALRDLAKRVGMVVDPSWSVKDLKEKVAHRYTSRAGAARRVNLMKSPEEWAATHGGGDKPAKAEAPKGDHHPDVQSALDRYDNRPASGGGLFGGDDLRAREGFAKLPDGARVVMVDGDNRGKTGRLTVEKSLDGSTRRALILDGETQTRSVTPTSVEPLRPEQSWRTDAGATGKDQQALFTQYVPRGEQMARQAADMDAERGKTAEAPKPAATEAPKAAPKSKRAEQRQHWHNRAKEAGVKPRELFAAAKQMSSHARAYDTSVSKMLSEARALYKSETGKNLSRNHPAFRGGDQTQLKGFDRIARTMAGRYPEILGHHGYEGSGEDDIAGQKLFDLLAVGPPQVSRPADHYESALEFLKSRPAKPPQEEAPF